MFDLIKDDDFKVLLSNQSGNNAFYYNPYAIEVDNRIVSFKRMDEGSMTPIFGN